MKQSLYNITEDYTSLILAIEDNEGELTQEMEEALIINENQLQSKSIAYLSVIKKNEALTAQIDDEVKRLQALKKQRENLSSRLEEALLVAVKLHGTIETEFNKFGTRKSESVEVEKINSLPVQFKVVKVVESADKKALKNALKKGEVIEGVTLKQNLNLKIN